jgi:hypothetical protein
MAGRLIESDPALAYEHAQAAVRRGGRVDIVREAAGLTAYALGNYAEALRELRTVRRLNGSSEHLPVMADCERGLGRPERAIALSRSEEADTLDAAARVELAIVVSGARLDLGELDAAGAVLDAIRLTGVDAAQVRRVREARLAVFEAAGDLEKAAALRGRLGPDPVDLQDVDDVLVLDTVDDGLEDDAAGSVPESAEPVSGDGWS